MKIDVSFEGAPESLRITFKLNEFKNKRDFVIGTSIIQIFSADFDLDPELDPDGLEDLIAEMRNEGKQKFAVEIDDDGLEIDLE